MVCGVTLAHLFKIEFSSAFQIFFTLLKLAAILSFISCGLRSQAGPALLSSATMARLLDRGKMFSRPASREPAFPGASVPRSEGANHAAKVTRRWPDPSCAPR